MALSWTRHSELLGVGKRRILNEMKKIVEDTSKVQIKSCLFERWEYTDSSPGPEVGPE